MPPAQLLKVPKIRVPDGSAFVRRRGLPAAGPAARIAAFAERRRLYGLSSTRRQLLPLFWISMIVKPCAAICTSHCSRVNCDWFCEVTPGKHSTARWLSWLTPSSPRVDEFEPRGSGMKARKSLSVPNWRSCSAPVCCPGRYCGAPRWIGSPWRISTCRLCPGATCALSSVVRPTSENARAADTSALSPGPVAIVPQPNSPNMLAAPMPRSAARRDSRTSMMSAMAGSVDGLTRRPSATSNGSCFISPPVGLGISSMRIIDSNSRLIG